MRGSTAGLADTLAGGSKAYAALLALADACFGSVLLAPVVVTYWRSTWTLGDQYLLPKNPIKSALISGAFGFAGNILMCLIQTLLTKYMHPDRGRMTYYIVSRLYTIVFGVVSVNSWRGVWNLLNELFGKDILSTWTMTAAAATALIAMRSLRNICAAPFAITVDTPHDYFDVPTMFRTSLRDTKLYILDCFFSVVVVGSLVVFVWRGLWTLLDIYIYPGEPFKTNLASLILGYALVAITFSLQSPARWACARLPPVPRLLLADVYHLLSFFATVNLWRGVWGMLDLYFLPERPSLSNWLSNGISLSILILLNCSNTVLVRGVYIDAEEPAGECVVFPCHYLRLFLHRERTKKRHKAALRAAAAAAAARKSEDLTAQLAPLHPPPVIIQEKV